MPPPRVSCAGVNDARAAKLSARRIRSGSPPRTSRKPAWRLCSNAAATRNWSLTSLREKLIKISAKIISHGGYVAFQMAEVAIPRKLFADIPRLIAELRAPPDSAVA